MALGWVVVKFDKNATPGLPVPTVGWFEYKEEAMDEADRLNETAPEGVWHGWEKNR